MTWQNQLNGDPLPWLLEPESPGARYLAMKTLLDLPETDPELAAARQKSYSEGPIATVLAAMDPVGYWAEPGAGYLPKYRSTVWSLILLAQLGASADDDERIPRACAYLLEQALAPGGQFAMASAPSGTVDCLQGNLCWSLVRLGYDDPRLERAYDWLARTITGEGIAPLEDKKAERRYYAGKCGPDFACGANNKLPCAWGGTKAMLALSVCPDQYRTPQVERAIRQGIDFFFRVDPVTADYPNGWSAKPSGNWWKFGFPVFYITDLLQVAEALAGVGCGQDPRLQSLLDLILSKQDTYSRWPLEYDYAGKTWVDFGPKKQPNKWVTLRALQVLKAIE